MHFTADAGAFEPLITFAAFVGGMLALTVLDMWICRIWERRKERNK